MKRIILLLVATLFFGLPLTTAQAAPTGSANAYKANNPAAADGAPRCQPDNPSACSMANGLISDIDSMNCRNPKARGNALIYSAGQARIREAIIRSVDRGCEWRLVTSRQKPDGEDEGVEPGGEMALLIKQLKERKQTVVVGWGALSRGGAHGSKYKAGKDSAGIQHEKIVTIDKGNGDQIVNTDSGNWTFSLDTDRNDRMRVVDPCLYKATVAHIDLMAKDRYVKSEKPAKTCDGRRTLYWFPTTHTDPLYSWLKNARCGSGDTVYVDPFYYAGSKASSYTKELIRLDKAKADVEVAANASWQHWSDYQKRRLVMGGVEVYYVVKYPKDKTGKDHLRYNHGKPASASGCQGGPFGEQGSTTINDTAFTKNNNHMMITRVSADVAAMQRAHKVLVAGLKPLNAVDVGCATYNSKHAIVPLPKNKRPAGC